MEESGLAQTADIVGPVYTNLEFIFGGLFSEAYIEMMAN